MEQHDLTTSITAYEGQVLEEENEKTVSYWVLEEITLHKGLEDDGTNLTISSEASQIILVLKAPGNIRKYVRLYGQEAHDLLVIINKKDFSTTSLDKTAMNWLKNNGYLDDGTVSGTAV